MAERYVVRSGQGESPLPEENMENVENVKSVREEKSPKCVEVKKKKPLKGCIFLSIAQSALSWPRPSDFRPRDFFFSSIPLPHEQLILFML